MVADVVADPFNEQAIDLGMVFMPPDADFRLMILLVRAKGISYGRQALEVDVHVSTLCNYVNTQGATPGYRAGARIINYARTMLTDEQMRLCKA